MDRFKVVVLISANTEWRIVRELLPEGDVHTSPYGDWFACSFPMKKGSLTVCVTHGGWGKVAAAASTQYAIDTWSPDLVINLGTCGGFEGHVNCKTVILVNKTVIYDIIEQMGDQATAIAHYTTEIDLSWLKQPFPYPVHTGLLLSGDRDLIPEQVEELHAQYGAIAGDWESAAIAYVVARNHGRCLILRTVTDLVGRNGGEVYDGALNLFHERAREAMTVLISSLPDWLRCAGY
jgi:adenosylhomocysteine nucleosidase